MFMIIQIRNLQNTKKKDMTKKKKKSLVDRTSQTQVEHESKKLLNGKENKESVDMDQSNNKKGTF